MVGHLFKTPDLLLCCGGTWSFPSLSKHLANCWQDRWLALPHGASRRCFCVTLCWGPVVEPCTCDFGLNFSSSEANSCPFCARFHRCCLSWLKVCICRGVSLCREMHHVEGIGFERQNLSARADKSCFTLPALIYNFKVKEQRHLCSCCSTFKRSFFHGFFVDLFTEAFIYLQVVLKNVSTLFSNVTCFTKYILNDLCHMVFLPQVLCSCFSQEITSSFTCFCSFLSCALSEIHNDTDSFWCLIHITP